ncbi:hypothetical protein C8R46DRAFT_1214984 [Mycena filopes]|nr:hypothetical protein C8R46DRAFT_1214984 [Mycena filopes]
MLSLKDTFAQITSYRLGYTSQRPYPWRWATPATLGVFLLISVFLTFLNVPLSAYEIIQESTYRPNDTLPPLLFSTLVPGILQSPEDSFEPHVLSVGDTLVANNSMFTFTIISAWDENSTPVTSFSYYNNPFSDGCDISNMTATFDLNAPRLTINVTCITPTLFQMTSTIQYFDILNSFTVVDRGDPKTLPVFLTQPWVNGALQNVFQLLYHLARLELGIIMENQIFSSAVMFNDSIFTADPSNYSDHALAAANRFRPSTSNLTLIKEWADIVQHLNTTDRVPVINYLRPVPRLKPLGSALSSIFVSTFAMVSVVWTVFSLIAGGMAARSEKASTEGGYVVSTIEDRIDAHSIAINTYGIAIDTYGIAIAQMEVSLNSLARMQLDLKKRGLLKGDDDADCESESSIACTSDEEERSMLLVHRKQSDTDSAV